MRPSADLQIPHQLYYNRQPREHWRDLHRRREAQRWYTLGMSILQLSQSPDASSSWAERNLHVSCWNKYCTANTSDCNEKSSRTEGTLVLVYAEVAELPLFQVLDVEQHLLQSIVAGTLQCYYYNSRCVTLFFVFVTALLSKPGGPLGGLDQATFQACKFCLSLDSESVDHAGNNQSFSLRERSFWAKKWFPSCLWFVGCTGWWFLGTDITLKCTKMTKITECRINMFMLIGQHHHSPMISGKLPMRFFNPAIILLVLFFFCFFIIGA